MPPYQFEVRRVPPQTEAGAASAFSQAPSLDGKRPGIVYFNLRDSAEWPKFCLATTVYHEGLPGHQFEGGLALSNQNLPLIRKIGGFSGYGEGWALYAEQLADELGMYDDDPLGRLGYLKFQLFRANRCVVDTGIHTLRWSREQAIRHFVEQDGEAPGFVHAITRTSHSPSDGNVTGSDARTPPAFDRILTNRTTSEADGSVANGFSVSRRMRSRPSHSTTSASNGSFRRNAVRNLAGDPGLRTTNVPAAPTLTTS